MSKYRLRIESKLNKEKWEVFEKLVSSLLQSGFDDLWLADGQTCIHLSLPEPDGWNLCLYANGTWKLE